MNVWRSIGGLAVLALLTHAAVACTASAPRDGSPRPVRALVVADLNGPYGSTEYPPSVTAPLQAAVTEHRPDVVIVAGDMIAGQSAQLPDDRVRQMWAAFDSAIAGPLRAAGVPLLVAVGNHDASGYPAHARDRRLALEHWSTRPPEGLSLPDADGYPLRYTVRIGDVFFAVWDATRQESGEDGALLGWLAATLRSPAARDARHRVVVGHLPLYPVAEGRDTPGEFLLNGDSLRRELESLGATMFVSGHHHAFYPGRRGELALLHAGALGSGPRPLVGGTSPAVNALAVVDFGRNSAEIRGFEVTGDGTLRPISIDTLPAVICAGQAHVSRIDLAHRAVHCGSPSSQPRDP